MSPWQQELGNRPSSLNGTTHMSKQVMHITMSTYRAKFISQHRNLYESHRFVSNLHFHIYILLSSGCMFIWKMVLCNCTTVESCITWLGRFLKRGEPIAWCSLITALKMAFIKVCIARGSGRTDTVTLFSGQQWFLPVCKYILGLIKNSFPPDLVAMGVKVLSHLYTLPTWTLIHYYWWGTELES